jgi:hypothetical protein
MRSFVGHPLFLILATALVTALLCRSWYRRRLRALERELAAALARLDAPLAESRREPFMETVPAVVPGDPTRAVDPAEVLRRLSEESADDYPSVPFVDTSPFTHQHEPPKR